MPHVLPHLMQHRKHGNVGLAGAGGGTHKQVLVAVERCGVDAALNAVQGPATSKKRVMRLQLFANGSLISTSQQGGGTCVNDNRGGKIGTEGERGVRVGSLHLCNI